MSTIKINREVEHITVKDDDGEVMFDWAVKTDDKSLEQMLHLVGNAMDRAGEYSQKAAEAETPEDIAELNEMTVRLFRRTISAIIGPEGYQDVLTYIGDGEPCDPANNIANIGEVFASLCTWLYSRCTSKQLREAGVYFEAESRKARRAKKSGKKRK